MISAQLNALSKRSEVTIQGMAILDIFPNKSKEQTFFSILFCLWKNSTLMSPHTGNGWGNSKEPLLFDEFLLKVPMAVSCNVALVCNCLLPLGMMYIFNAQWSRAKVGAFFSPKKSPPTLKSTLATSRNPVQIHSNHRCERLSLEEE